MQSVGNSTSVSNLQRVVRQEPSLIPVIPFIGHRLTHSGPLHDEGRGIQCSGSFVAQTFLADLHQPEPRIQTSKGGPRSGRIGRRLLVDEDYRGTESPSGKTGRTHPQTNTLVSIAGSLGGFLLLAG
jgi:hypothetical protein